MIEKCGCEESQELTRIACELLEALKLSVDWIAIECADSIQIDKAIEKAEKMLADGE